MVIGAIKRFSRGDDWEPRENWQFADHCSPPPSLSSPSSPPLETPFPFWLFRESVFRARVKTVRSAIGLETEERRGLREGWRGWRSAELEWPIQDPTTWNLKLLEELFISRVEYRCALNCAAGNVYVGGGCSSNFPRTTPAKLNARRLSIVLDGFVRFEKEKRFRCRILFVSTRTDVPFEVSRAIITWVRYHSKMFKVWTAK